MKWQNTKKKMPIGQSRIDASSIFMNNNSVHDFNDHSIIRQTSKLFFFSIIKSFQAQRRWENIEEQKKIHLVILSF